MKDPLLPSPNSKNQNLGEREPDSLPHFRFLKMGGDTEEGNFPLKTTFYEKKCYILEFQVK